MRSTAQTLLEYEHYYDRWEDGRMVVNNRLNRSASTPSFADEHYMQSMTAALLLEPEVLPISLTYARFGPKGKYIEWGVSGLRKTPHPAWWHAVRAPSRAGWSLG